MNNQDFNSVSSTAIVTSYPRIFTDIPYEKEIYNWVKKNCHETVTLNKMMAPEIEARYKLINKILNNSKITQILELASGYSGRGLIYSEKGYCYVEMDLDAIVKNKINLLKEIKKEIPANLKILSSNVLRKEDFNQYKNYFQKEEPVAIIIEGLLRYLTFEEKKLVAENIYHLLSVHGGIWITSDVTPKKFSASQEKVIPNFESELSQITSRNNLNNRFENINQVKDFFGKIGFEIKEIHKFKEVKENLYSLKLLNITGDSIDQTLEDAIVVVMTLKEKRRR